MNRCVRLVIFEGAGSEFEFKDVILTVATFIYDMLPQGNGIIICTVCNVKAIRCVHVNVHK